MSTTARNHRFGLQQVYPAIDSKDETTIDIIAIHGLDTSAPGTWEYRYDKNNGGVTNWLSDAAMLPAAVPRGRIFTYNWHAKFYKNAVDLTLKNLAEGLLLDIRAMREEKGYPRKRPIVFIASCFGGLVLAKALNSAAIEGGNYSFLRYATVGVVFLGTPFKGTATYRKAQWLIAYGGLIGEKTSESLIKDLDRSTGVLDDLVQDFARSAHTSNYHLPIHCFFETKATNLSKKVLPKSLSNYLKVKDFLVDQDSACLLGFDRNSLDCAHIMMNKFVPGTDFDRVKSVISNFAQHAGNILAQRDGSQLSSSKDKQCSQDLRLTDPSNDKVKIEDRKDHLLKDSFVWILGHRDFINWRDDDKTRLLWIRGDPGKGKTMLLIGIIDELSQQLKSIPNSSLLSYFFCQGADSNLNNATVVLRGLIYLLLVQQTSLISHLREEYDRAGRRLFEDGNAFFALSKIFTDMLHDPCLTRLPRIYLIVDALDECESGLSQLLDLIVRNVSATSSRVKWLVSSRNRPEIEDQLTMDNNGPVKLSLELNANHISSAVDAYISHKVSELKKYDSKLQDQVRGHMRQKANGTFLWVALIYKELRKVESWDALQVLSEMPTDLQQLYSRMMKQIRQLKRKNPEFCRLIISTTALAYRPPHLQELANLTGLPESFLFDIQSMAKIVNMCGSFLTIRDETVYFVHQSAKDYISTDANSEVFPAGRREVHCGIVSRSLQIMSDTLRRDIYDLQDPGTSIDQVISLDPDPLARIRYACVYWIDHLCEIGSDGHGQVGLCDNGIIDIFLKKHFLHWLEALSLMRSMSTGVVMIRKLENLLAQNSNDAMNFLSIIRDANRFILYNRSTIENAPLQVYTSALIFSPTQSLIRELFREEEPRWITTSPIMGNNWSLCLQALEGHSGAVLSVALSPDGRRLASASIDKTVRVWETETGALQQTLEGHSSTVWSVAFSPDGRRLASASIDKTIRVWETETGALQQTLAIGTRISQLTFGPHDSHLVTELGSIILRPPSSRSIQEPNWSGYCLKRDRSWITCNGSNVVWLPSEYRPLCSMIVENTVAIGCSSGRVLLIKFSSDIFPTSSGVIL